MFTLRALVYVSCVFCFVYAGDGPSWGYAGSTGPENWGKINKLCDGKNQSPIDFKPAELKQQQPGTIIFTGYDSSPASGVKYELENNGHTVVVELKPGTDIRISGGGLPGTDFSLAQFHLHWGRTDCQGSEHTVNGKHFPLEIHFVHKNNKYGSVQDAVNHPDGLAVVGVFVDVGQDAHEVIDTSVFPYFPNITYAKSEMDIPAFRLQTLLPANRDHYMRYSGSLTTPTCNEAVTWTVLKNPIQVSARQMNVFRALSHNAITDHHDDPLDVNFRPVQDLNQRTVIKTFNDDGIEPRAKTTCVAAILSAATAAWYLVAAVCTVFVTKTYA